MWWILISLLILGGCLGETTSAPTNSKIVKEDNTGAIMVLEENSSSGKDNGNISEDIGNEDNEGDSFNWGTEEPTFEDVKNFTYKPSDPVYVRFFNVGLPNSPKQGRLIQIRRGDLDIFIWSVPKEMFGKAYGYIKSYADDVEYLIIPSPRKVNTEALPLLFNKTMVGEIIAPHTMNLPYNATYLKEGDVLQIANITLKVWKAGDKGFQTPGDNGFILSLNTTHDTFLFLLDAETGLFKKFIIDYAGKLNATYFSWNAYGGIIDVNTYNHFLSFFHPEYMVADGSSYSEYDAEGGSRDGIYNRVSIYHVNYTKVWNHDFVGVVLSNNSYIIGG